MNSLSIRDTRVISGRVKAFGPSDTLILEDGNSPSLDLGLFDNFGHFVKNGSGTWTITGSPGQQSARDAWDLNVTAGRLNLIGANWEIPQITNSGTVSVGAGSVLRVKGDERSFFANNGTLIVGIGGFVDGRFFNHGTITNLAKLRDEGFQNRGGKPEPS